MIGSFDGVDWGVLFAASTVQLLPILLFVLVDAEAPGRRPDAAARSRADPVQRGGHRWLSSWTRRQMLGSALAGAAAAAAGMPAWAAAKTLNVLAHRVHQNAPDHRRRRRSHQAVEHRARRRHRLDDVRHRSAAGPAVPRGQPRPHRFRRRLPRQQPRDAERRAAAARRSTTTARRRRSRTSATSRRA